MSNAHGKTIDTTYLSLEHAADRLYFHRDYIAHLNRWTHTLRIIPLVKTKMKRKIQILDIGCGAEQPLAKVLYVRMLSSLVAGYTGVDIRPKLKKHEVLEKIKTFKTRVVSADAANLHGDQLLGPPDLITCFEMVEHVEYEHALRVLKRLRMIARPGAVLLLSTPCFNGKAADNHVNEMTFDQTAGLLKASGWHVKHVYGTFASVRDYEKVLAERYGDGAYQLFLKLQEYYYPEQLATVFAPAFPEYSRNCLWHCTNENHHGDDLKVPKGRLKIKGVGKPKLEPVGVQPMLFD